MGRTTGDLIPENERQALLRLNALVGNAPIQELFNALSEELSRIVNLEAGESFLHMAGVSRFDPDGMLTALAATGPRPDWPAPAGSRWPLDGDSANGRVYRTGRPARVQGHIPVTGAISQRLNEVGATASIAVPIFVDNQLWGSVTVVSDRPERLPDTTEQRLAEFAALASTAISSAQRREALQRLAEEHAALRRVATIVATRAEPEQIWRTVVAEVGELCGAARAGLARYDAEDTMTVLASWDREPPRGPLPDRWPVGGTSLFARMLRERAVVRVDDWSTVDGVLAAIVRERVSIGTSIMTPIFQDERLWGGLYVHSPVGEEFAGDAERRLAGFAELVGTALANAAARAEVRRLADEQATIRRIATLVARQTPVPEICRRVTEELGPLLGVEDVRLLRYDGDEATVLGSWGLAAGDHPAGSTLALDGDIAVVRVRRDGRPVRLDGYDHIAGESARQGREAGLRSTVALPIFVGDRLWGALAVASPQPGRIPESVEQPITDCVDLIATAVRNAEADESLRASRQRIVAATDQARRRFERDLHDGAQQRLVALGLDLRGRDDLVDAAEEVDAILADLQSLSRGLHPASLTEGGLAAAIGSLIRRSPTPVQLALPDDWPRLAEPVEIACYYVVAEALTNVAKHARAAEAHVRFARGDGRVRVTVSDDGVGGADPAGGSGLVGIADRLEALGGSVSLTSPPGAGTTLVAKLPVAPGSAATRDSDAHRQANASPGAR